MGLSKPTWHNFPAEKPDEFYLALKGKRIRWKAPETLDVEHISHPIEVVPGQVHSARYFAIEVVMPRSHVFPAPIYLTRDGVNALQQDPDSENILNAEAPAYWLNKD